MYGDIPDSKTVIVIAVTVCGHSFGSKTFIVGKIKQILTESAPRPILMWRVTHHIQQFLA